MGEKEPVQVLLVQASLCIHSDPRDPRLFSPRQIVGVVIKG